MSEVNRCLYLDNKHNLTIENKEIPKPGPGQVLVKVAANGICGSDIHFFQDGRLGNFVVTTPYIPGHEASGTIVALGTDANLCQQGQRVVIEPGIACGLCAQCKIGRYNLCPKVVFLSAPPVDGTFCDYLCINENFVFPIPDSLSLEHAAFAEPLAVAIHSINRAQMRPGETGVIVGAGPIGLLTLQAFKAAGGGRVVCVDLLESRLEVAKKLGADDVIIPGKDMHNIGDVIFETAGSSSATAGLFQMAKHGGRVVQVGWPDGNKVELDIAVMMDKELDYIGVNRYANAFEAAVTWLADGRIVVDDLITQRYQFNNAPEAFNWANERPNETIKVIVTN
ncbi:MAG: NAD(P)-dependent alcohol dehydrogenase [Defluviitaleaceae bacterium]|nr:NAD(P)-dependent alcohol dehydrogenase [Defluviitaleaceae bacterium]